MEYEKLNPKAKKCMYTSEAIGFLITAAILIAARLALAGVMPARVAFWANIIGGAIIGLYFISFLIAPPIRYHRYRYLINEEKIDVIEGFIFITRTIVPIERIQQIDTKRGPIDNLFGLAKVIVTTAGGKATISFLELPKADFIADSLKNKINDLIKQNRQEEA